MSWIRKKNDRAFPVAHMPSKKAFAPSAPKALVNQYQYVTAPTLPLDFLLIFSSVGGLNGKK
ncbi:hypothetical protein [Desulfobulbus propionicus]|jgi:hypothetical protein